MIYKSIFSRQYSSYLYSVAINIFFSLLIKVHGIMKLLCTVFVAKLCGQPLLFQKIAICNDKRQINVNLTVAKIKIK